MGDFACDTGSFDLPFQVVCGSALSDRCDWRSGCRSAGCMGSSENGEIWDNV